MYPIGTVVYQWCSAVLGIFVHTHTHTRAVQFRGNPREDGQAWSEKKGKEDKLEAMQKGEEKWGRFFHSAAL